MQITWKIKTSSYVQGVSITSQQGKTRQALEIKKAFDFIVCASDSL